MFASESVRWVALEYYLTYYYCIFYYAELAWDVYGGKWTWQFNTVGHDISGWYLEEEQDFNSRLVQQFNEAEQLLFFTVLK